VIVEVDAVGCVASGQYNTIARSILSQNDDGFSLVVRQPDPGEADDVQEAGRVCPSRAIRIDGK
jgi:ferredoxin